MIRNSKSNCQALRALTAALLVLSSLTIWSQIAWAADDLVMISVPTAMETAPYAEKLDGSVKFYFGDSAHPEVLQTYGNFVTNKKTNGFAKSAGVACNHVLLSALISLQEQAKSLGGNAVINIKSYFKQNEASYDSEVECYKGFLIASVALKGDVVKVADGSS